MQSVLRRLFLAALGVLFLASPSSLQATDFPEIFPLSQVQPGMKGVAYTIFEGDKIEKMDLLVVGVLHNAMGPKEDVILVQLVGEKV